MSWWNTFPPKNINKWEKLWFLVFAIKSILVYHQHHHNRHNNKKRLIQMKDCKLCICSLSFSAAVVDDKTNLIIIGIIKTNKLKSTTITTTTTSFLFFLFFRARIQNSSVPSEPQQSHQHHHQPQSLDFLNYFLIAKSKKKIKQMMHIK